MAVGDDQTPMDADGREIMDSSGRVGIGPDCCCVECTACTGASADYTFQHSGHDYQLVGDNLSVKSGNGALYACDDTTVTITALTAYPGDVFYEPRLLPIVNGVPATWNEGGHLGDVGGNYNEEVTIDLLAGDVLQLAEDPDRNGMCLWGDYLRAQSPWPATAQVTLPESVSETEPDCLPYLGQLLDIGGVYPEYLDAAISSEFPWIVLHKVNAADAAVRYESVAYEGGTGARFVLTQKAADGATHVHAGRWVLTDTSGPTDYELGYKHPWPGGQYDPDTEDMVVVARLPSALSLDVDYTAPCTCTDASGVTLTRAFDGTTGKPSYSGGDFTLTVSNVVGRWTLDDTACDTQWIDADKSAVVRSPEFDCAYPTGFNFGVVATADPNCDPGALTT